MASLASPLATHSGAPLSDDPNIRGDVPMVDPVEGREPLIRGGHDYHYITETVCRVNETPILKTPGGFWFLFLLSASLFAMFIGYVGWLFWEGPGIWGNNNPVAWAWDIVNFVFWVGIGHAGTLISAILYLFRQKWRTSINRYAEAMTIFAVVCAGSCVVLHTGRIWLDYWLFPIPNQMSLWPNFRSPLEWDVFAVNTYFTVSLLFWYTGLVPDFATLRDRATNRFRQLFYGALALGWRGSMRHWVVYEKTYQILAAFSAPLVLSVHTIVSFDFAVSQLPGWHTTIFPPYFVAGAIFSGFGMVMTLMLPLRAVYRLEDLITQYHIDCMCKITLATGTMVGYAYSMEFFIAWYSSNPTIESQVTPPPRASRKNVSCPLPPVRKFDPVNASITLRPENTVIASLPEPVRMKALGSVEAILMFSGVGKMNSSVSPTTPPV